MRQGNSREDYPEEATIERELVVCAVRETTPAAIAATTETVIGFTLEDSDTLGMHSNTVNPDRITLVTPVPADATGIHITGWVQWDAGSGIRELHVSENGATIGATVSRLARAFEIEQTVHWVGSRSLPVGNYFGLIVYSTQATSVLAARFEFKLTFT